MRICFLGDGNSVHIKRWIDYFKGKNHEVHLITFTDTDISYIPVYKVGNFDVNMNGGNWKYVLCINSVKKILNKIKPDLVNAHFVTSYGFIAALSSKYPLVVSAWGTDILVTPKRNFIYKCVTKYALNKSELITSDSMFMTDEIKKLTNTNTITVPMGVEEKLCNMKRKANEDEIKILSLRTVNENSNIDTIIKAFELVKKHLPEKKIKLIITNNGPELDNVLSLIDKLQLNDSIEVKGFVSRDELIELLISSQIYITIPSSDATSVTMLEAMAAGTFIIASDIPANKEWLNDGENALVIKDINESDLSECIKKCIMDYEFRMKTQILNREIINERALWDKNMSCVEEEYSKLINL